MPEISSGTGSDPVNPRRRAWFLATARIAWVAGLFTLVLGGLLLVNSVRLYQGAGNGKVRLVEAEKLLPLKIRLRDEPNNAELKEEVRILDQQLRYEFFRRERLAARGGVLLLAGATVFIIALQIALYLKRPRLPVPQFSPQRDDPTRESRRAGRAVAGASLGLAALTMASVWGISKSWDRRAVLSARTGPDEGANAVPAGDGSRPFAEPAWFPSPDEIAANWPRFRGRVIPACDGALPASTSCPATSSAASADWTASSNRRGSICNKVSPDLSSVYFSTGMFCIYPDTSGTTGTTKACNRAEAV